ncbi:MAG: ATP-binding protein [Bacillota bacterium]|nr:ATP-binding protein [Bacillota bacterium]MDI7248689.1 ATP-binding protein [Bacillota bacterium]
MAFVGVALVGIAVTAIATGITVARRFDVYVGRYQRLRAEQAAAVLEQAYRRGGLDEVIREADRLAGMTGLYARLVDAQGNVVWEHIPRPEGYPGPGGMPPAEGPQGPGPRWRPGVPAVRQQAIPLVVDGRQVATLYVAAPAGSRRMEEELAFLAGVRRSLWLGGGLAALIAIVVGLAMARSISLPLLRLRGAAERLRQGDLSLQVPERGSEEMVDLARAFNLMVHSLARQRELRRNLTADVAHELRTPLAVVRGHIEAMQDGVWEASPENLAALHAEIMRLVRLVGELEKLNEAESGALELAPTRVDLGELARRVVAAFGPSFDQKGVALKLDIQPGVPPVWGDEDRLSQVVWNLLSNALKFTPRGGRVAVRVFPAGARSGPIMRGTAQAPPRTAHAPLRAAQGPGSVCLSVADSGPGIAPEDLPYVFERFFRARPRPGGAEAGPWGAPPRGAERGSVPPGQIEPGLPPEQGVGLGLAISQALARAHGGHIEVESEPGQGATFTLVLPAMGVQPEEDRGR